MREPQGEPKLALQHKKKGLHGDLSDFDLHCYAPS
jgi:hypothetical protein